MNIPEYDFAKLSPVMAKERFINNYESSILKLTKKTMEQNASAILDLLGSSQAVAGHTPETSTIDLKL